MVMICLRSTERNLERSRKSTSHLWLLITTLITALLVITCVRGVWAQDKDGSATTESSTGSKLHLYVDPKTGQLFISPGPGRVPFTISTTALASALSSPSSASSAASSQPNRDQELQQIQKRQQTLEIKAQELQDQIEKTTEQVNQILPAWQHYIDTLGSKMYIGAQFWADWAFYPRTGYGPQLLTQINQPGPGNGGYNSIDITRSYLNVFFNPTNDWILRITPNLYRQVGGTNNAPFGAISAIPNSVNGDYAWRLKYGYAQYTKIFSGIDALSDDSLIIGQQPEPLVPWEEDLYQFRYVNLVTWNMSIASTFPGITIQGPVRLGPERLQYIDYNVGVFDEGSFHALEQANTKEAMARISIYPFGARWRFDGLGITTFYDIGWGNVTPDVFSSPAFLKGPQAQIERLAEIIHYTADTWGIAFEYDWGRNAWTPGNMFSGSGPAELFGITPTVPALVESQTLWSNLANALQNNGRTFQQGFNLFGHVLLGDTPFTLFGWLEWWLANTAVPVNPFDFYRVVIGISYQFNEYVRIALDYQGIIYYHHQFNFPVSEAEKFNFVLPPQYAGVTQITKVVPDSIDCIMMNFEYAF